MTRGPNNDSNGSATASHSRNAYNKGFQAGFSHAYKTMKDHLDSISLFILTFILLRDLMIFTEVATLGKRRITKKICGKTIPAISTLEKVRKLAQTNPYNFEKGVPIYRNVDSETDYWEFGDYEKNHPLYKGHIVPVLNTIEKLGWRRTSISATMLPIQKTVYALVWTDGARVDRPTLYGRFRLIDKSKEIVKETATPMFYFYGFIGKDADLYQFSKIRNEQIELMEQNLYETDDKIIFKIVFRYISGDNSYIWKDMAITGVFRCGACIRSVDGKWMIFNPHCTQRTVKFQSEHVGQFGIKKITPWAEQGRKPNHAQVICVVAVMHDLKHTLDHGITLALHFTERKGYAEKLVTERLAKVLKGTPISWNRHIREVFSNWDFLFEGLLEHQPGKWGVYMCYLCNTKNVTNEELYYAQLQTYSFLYGIILTRFWEKSQFPKQIKKVDKCNSVYDHAIFNHLADQFWKERILPIYLAEDLGEASIKQLKSFNSDHSREDTILKGILGEQYSAYIQPFLPVSKTNEYRNEKQRNKKLVTPIFQNVTFHECTLGYSDPHSFANFIEVMRDRVGSMVKRDGLTHTIDFGCETTFNFCVCGEHREYVYTMDVNNEELPTTEDINNEEIPFAFDELFSDSGEDLHFDFDDLQF